MLRNIEQYRLERRMNKLYNLEKIVEYIEKAYDNLKEAEDY